MEREVISKGTTPSKDPSTENEMNLFGTTQAQLHKPSVDKVKNPLRNPQVGSIILSFCIGYSCFLILLNQCKSAFNSGLTLNFFYTHPKSE